MPEKAKKPQPTKKPAQSKPQPEKQPKPVNKPAVVALKTIEIDASGRILGRLATEVADILRGKKKPTFVPNKNCGDKVVVKNASKIVVTGNKMVQKRYYRHSGYLGHLTSESMADKMRKNPSEIIITAVSGMLPKNKLRKEWLKNLTVLNDNGEK